MSLLWPSKSSMIWLLTSCLRCDKTAERTIQSRPQPLIGMSQPGKHADLDGRNRWLRGPSLCWSMVERGSAAGQQVCTNVKMLVGPNFHAQGRMSCHFHLSTGMAHICEKTGGPTLQDLGSFPTKPWRILELVENARKPNSRHGVATRNYPSSGWMPGWRSLGACDVTNLFGLRTHLDPPYISHVVNSKQLSR